MSARYQSHQPKQQFQCIYRAYCIISVTEIPRSGSKLLRSSAEQRFRGMGSRGSQRRSSRKAQTVSTFIRLIFCPKICTVLQIQTEKQSLYLHLNLLMVISLLTFVPSYWEFCIGMLYDPFPVPFPPFLPAPVPFRRYSSRSRPVTVPFLTPPVRL